MNENTNEITTDPDDRPAEVADTTDAGRNESGVAPDASPEEETRKLDATTPDDPHTAPLPLTAPDSPDPATTWQLPAGKPPESPAARPPHDLPPLTPERDVWSAPRKGTLNQGAEAQKNGANTASAPAAPRGVRASTLVWGLILLVLGGLLLAVAVGVKVDPVTALIVLLAGIGVALLIIALLPHRKADGRQ
ncbi:hypothetical protein [Actinomyces glycerinitolerans]|uniref:Uncharacterized protein n=1 Tax=Actinomyces glycerinitolerans TaxID=1892869 RepID=A0A1M4RXX9_9ACTO|nr:hypothetical protein [Actinomyces glycerinitolerans]SHE24855.1 Hypothetical protein ACGLYG10_1065 [Actinomyces glycerinitolerans]